MVLGVHRRHPGIIAANAHLCGKDAQEHVLRLRQLVLVLSLLKHEAGVRQQAYRERRGTIGAADAHAVAVIVGNLGPTHILMVARLLRHEVRRMIRESVGAPHAELGVFAVQVRLRRAGAEEPQVRVLHRQRPFDAERRDGGQVTLLSRVFDVQVHAAIGVGRVGDGHLGALRGGELIRVRALERAVVDLLEHVVHAAGVAAGAQPLDALETVTGAAIVVGQRTEGGDCGTAQHELVAGEGVGDHAALGARQQDLASGASHAGVPTAHGDGPIGRLRVGRRGGVRGHHGLSEGELVAAFGPIGRLGETLRNLQHQFAGVGAVRRHRPCDIERAGLTGGHVETPGGLPDRLAVGENAQDEHVVAGGGEQVVVLDGHRVLRHVDVDVRVQLLDFLGLGGRLAVGEQQAVAGELVVGRTVAEVSAVAQAPGAVGLGGVDGLVDEVPDEAALILRVAFERRVFVHVAHGVAHGVHVFAGEVRLLRVVLQVLLDFVGMRVHTGLDVGDVIVVTVVGHALVVHRTVRVDVVHVLVHGAEHVAHVGFVAQ